MLLPTESGRSKCRQVLDGEAGSAPRGNTATKGVLLSDVMLVAAVEGGGCRKVEGRERGAPLDSDESAVHLLLTPRLPNLGLQRHPGARSRGRVRISIELQALEVVETGWALTGSEIGGENCSLTLIRRAHMAGLHATFTGD